MTEGNAKVIKSGDSPIEMSRDESPVTVTAIFDIGKTNKKFMLFDQEFRVVFRQIITLEPAVDDDGDPCEDLDRLTDWIHQMLDKISRDHRFNIRHLNFATYGATLVHLNQQGEVLSPVYDYNKDFPEELMRELYDRHGGEEVLSLETSSPPMGMLNSGLQLYWLKRQKPDIYRRIHRSLHFPQYLSYLFTGRMISELTSIGCHTAMWDFRDQNYHKWLNQEGLAGLLPDPVPAHETVPVQLSEHTMMTGPGIHDSSAALVPYLKSLDERFLLVSTGTWSITLNPFSSDELTFDELQRDCLCYLNIYGEQVKSARLHLGGEYDLQMERIRNFFQKDSETYSTDGETLTGVTDEEINSTGRERADESNSKSQIDIQPDLYHVQNLLKRPDAGRGLRPALASRSGPCPSDHTEPWDLSQFGSKEEAASQLILDLVCLQEISVKLVQGSSDIDSLLLTGGFANNNLFLTLLASRLPELKVYTTALSEATALGAALVLHPESTDKVSGDLDLKLHEAEYIKGLDNYRWNPASNYSRTTL